MNEQRPIPPQPNLTEPGEPALGLNLDRAEDILPADLIQGGETIILLLKPSPLFIFLGCLGHMLFITGLTAVTYLAADPYLSSVINESQALLLGVLALLARLTWQMLDWYFQLYVLTDQRVITRYGILRRFVFEAPLRKLQHTYMLQSLRERVLNLGTIAFATAGTAAPESYWLMVHRPAAVHRRVVQAINRYGR